MIAKPLKEKVCRKGSLPKPFVIDKDSLKELVELEVSQLNETVEGLLKSMDGVQRF